MRNSSRILWSFPLDILDGYRCICYDAVLSAFIGKAQRFKQGKHSLHDRQRNSECSIRRVGHSRPVCILMIYFTQHDCFIVKHECIY